ncbi:MAG: hypothetical protein ITG00_01900 [Flavobacterium sp.]|nr:hypothetical protein [Flavobacterium sp.]
MSKSIKKNNRKWNVPALKALASKYDFSTRYIKQCITGDRNPIFADRIKSEYSVIVNQLKEVLDNEEI